MIVRDGAVACWGRDSIGQRREDAAPTLVPELRGATSLFAADGATCAQVTDGILCWGDMMFGELGMPARLDYVQVPEPWMPIGPVGVAHGAMGMQGACAFDATGHVHCWGEIAGVRDGDIGSRFGPVPEPERVNNDVTGRTMTAPRRVAALDGAVQLALGIDHTCGLMPDRTVRCLGGNAVGQLGRPVTPLDRYHPAGTVEGLSGVTDIGAGLAFTCALTTRGEIWCWGANREGQLGTRAEEKLAPVVRYATIPGDPHDRFAAWPVRVDGLPAKAKALGVGAMHACAILEDGRAACWGANDAGQLGDGTTDRRGTAVLARGITNAMEVAASAYGPEGNTCFLLADGRVQCVGRNGGGECGVAPSPRVAAPVEVSLP